MTAEREAELAKLRKAWMAFRWNGSSPEDGVDLDSHENQQLDDLVCDFVLRELDATRNELAEARKDVQALRALVSMASARSPR